MSIKRHGLATYLKSIKSHSWINEKYGSPIKALQAGCEPPYWNKPRPSIHIKRLCLRILQGKAGATFEDWNAIVDKVINRAFSGRGEHGIRSALTQTGSGLIAAWHIDRETPMHPECVEYFSHDPGGDRRAKEVAELLDRYWKCDLCGASKKTNRRRQALRDWRAERNAQGGVRRGQPSHISPGNYLCAECNAWVRKEIKQVERAQRALADLEAQTKILNAAIKEINHGSQ